MNTLFVLIIYRSPLTALYFIFLVISGSFVVLNLALAVINDQFDHGDSEDSLQDSQNVSEHALWNKAMHWLNDKLTKFGLFL